MIYENIFLLALALTLAIEIPTAVLLLKDLARRDVALTAFTASFATLPYLWFVLPNYIVSAHYLLIGEVFVIAFEAAVYNQFLKTGIRPALAVSAIANTASFLAGMVFLRSLF
jgi:hypothetical protein